MERVMQLKKIIFLFSIIVSAQSVQSARPEPVLIKELINDFKKSFENKFNHFNEKQKFELTRDYLKSSSIALRDLSVKINIAIERENSGNANHKLLNYFDLLVDIAQKNILIFSIYPYVFSKLQNLKEVSEKIIKQYRSPEEVQKSIPMGENTGDNFKNFLNQSNNTELFIKAISKLLERVRTLDMSLIDYHETKDENNEIQFLEYAQNMAGRVVLVFGIYPFLYDKINGLKEVDEKFKKSLISPKELQEKFQYFRQ